MHFLLSNLFLKIMIGAAVVVAVVGMYSTPKKDVPCTEIANYPNRSSVYQCPAGLNTVALHAQNPTYATVTTDVMAEAWLTNIGDGETAKTVRKHLGPSVVLGPGSFMAVGNGNGLVYILSKTRFDVTVVWDAHNH